MSTGSSGASCCRWQNFRHIRDMRLRRSWRISATSLMFDSTFFPTEASAAFACSDASQDNVGSIPVYKNLAWLNGLPAEDAESEFLNCCGSTEWARRMAAARPFAMLDELFRK